MNNCGISTFGGITMYSIFHKIELSAGTQKLNGWSSLPTREMAIIWDIPYLADTLKIIDHWLHLYYIPIEYAFYPHQITFFWLNT